MTAPLDDRRLAQVLNFIPKRRQIFARVTVAQLVLVAMESFEVVQANGTTPPILSRSAAVGDAGAVRGSSAPL